jgi:PhzF family phenazine biosynthesis protein
MPQHPRPRPFRQVDVFGDSPGEGNPVAVVLDADDLDAEAMQRFTSWTNLSECTFVLPPTNPDADYRVRIFTPTQELPFAGHPTLGTARAWLDAGGAAASAHTVVQECGAGLVPVRIDGEVLAFAAPPRVRTGPLDEALVDDVRAILGVDDAQLEATEWLDNGPGWVGVLLRDAASVLALRPDASVRPGHWDIGVLGVYGDGDDIALEVRAFFTDGTGALREDPVTGSLNAAAAQWLISAGRLPSTYVAAQGGAVGRRGRVHIDETDATIWVGGRTDVVVTGTVTL